MLHENAEFVKHPYDFSGFKHNLEDGYYTKQRESCTTRFDRIDRMRYWYSISPTGDFDRHAFCGMCGALGRVT